MGEAPSCVLRVKVVPNASRTALAGWLGDALKVKVAAVPEDGKANVALCGFIAALVGVGRRHVYVESGDTSREKRVRVEGLTESEVLLRLGL